jgi:hypothetical protein
MAIPTAIAIADTTGITDSESASLYSFQEIVNASQIEYYSPGNAASWNQILVTVTAGSSGDSTM